jgi:hypothetical protein
VGQLPDAACRCLRLRCCCSNQHVCRQPVLLRLAAPPRLPATHPPVHPYIVLPSLPFCTLQVLDAPALADDYYLNLVDWSAQNTLAVGLGTCVYLWSACTSKVTRLVDFGEGGAVCRCGRRPWVGCVGGGIGRWSLCLDPAVPSLPACLGRSVPRATDLLPALFCPCPRPRLPAAAAAACPGASEAPSCP